MNVSPELVRARLDDLQRATERRRLLHLAAARVRRSFVPRIARAERSALRRALAWFAGSQLGPTQPSERD